MRGVDRTKVELFSYLSLEDRIPERHPLRQLRVLVDSVMASMDAEFDGLYSVAGRESIPPERLLRAILLQMLFSIRSERQLVEHIEYNLLYRWFVGLGMDEALWHHATFSANRDRLFNEDISRLFFNRILMVAEWKKLVSDEHFSVDGTLIGAWASLKSFQKKDGTSNPPDDNTRNPSFDFKGEKRTNATHESTTDAQARLYKKSEGDKAVLCYMGHALMENRSGLVVDVETTQASGTAEREAATTMVARTVDSSKATLGADKGYDMKSFVAAMREQGVTPHVAQKKKGSAIDKRTTRHSGYARSIKARKRVEEVFGWSKTVGGLRQTKFRGLARVTAQTVFTFAAYNLTRIATLFGWRSATTWEKSA